MIDGKIKINQVNFVSNGFSMSLKQPYLTLLLCFAGKLDPLGGTCFSVLKIESIDFGNCFVIFC